jgi:hypothetical protein
VRSCAVEMLLRPGESLLMDHMMADTPGRLPNTFGKEPLQTLLLIMRQNSFKSTLSCTDGLGNIASYIEESWSQD